MHPFQEIESKWQKFWEARKTFRTELVPGKPKFYALDMFPYPSGAGLHVGHPKGYTANDIVARYKKAKGFNVLHPMGWDSFGLPAENYAVKTGTHPEVTTKQNIGVFTRQIKSLGLSYDWDRELATTDVEYYKWTQWIFLKMFEAGLAYEAELPVNWCPNLKCVLANEEVVDGKSEVGGHPVVRRTLRQWVLRITQYADRLAKDVKGLDWPEGIKDQQVNWIGRSEGVEFAFDKADEPSVKLKVYTTRIDTVYGVTYVVIAPDHKEVGKFVTADRKAACDAYIAAAAGKSDQDRTQGDKEKTGVFSGSFVVNPFNGEKVPVWIGDYVLGNYGTGAVMAVPAHDERDFAFAKKMGLTIRTSVVPNGTHIRPGMTCEATRGVIGEIEKKYSVQVTLRNEAKNDWILFGRIETLMAVSKEPGVRVLGWEDISAEDRKFIADIGTNPWIFTDDGILVDAGDNFTGLSSADARAKMAAYAQEKGFGGIKVNYKLRDWIFSRQRYWGEPMPLIHLNIEDLKKLPHIDSLSQATDSKLAYILKRDPLPGEGDCKGATCDGKVRVLVIGGKEFSKIYDGFDSKIVCDWRLPLALPAVQKYEPTDDGQSPLAHVADWVNVQLADNLKGRRETNTMPQWAGSCWYYLRFMDPRNGDAPASKETLEYWGSVDSYVGGAEHAVLHLLYARFWHKFLFDIGAVPTSEPFARLRSQGLILAANGEKMSKSKGNVVNPDSVVAEVGADALRLYEMAMADFKDPAPWDTRAIVGISRFLDRAYGFATAVGQGTPEQDVKRMKLLHKTIKKVGEDIENYKFNTAISALIILTNEGLPADAEMAAEWKSVFARLLHPFAPHLAEEIWEKLGNKESVFLAPWPDYEPMMCQDDEVTFAIQVSGKVRATMTFPNGVAKEEVTEAALANPDVAKWLEGKKVVREVFVPNKLLNIVAV